MYAKHIAQVVADLLKQAEELKHTDRISSLHVSCSELGPNGPEARGTMNIRLRLRARSNNNAHIANALGTTEEEVEKMRAETREHVIMPRNAKATHLLR